MQTNNNVYKYLEFNNPDFLINPYGIQIHIGTEGKADWCVVIPKELVKQKSESNPIGYIGIIRTETDERIKRFKEKMCEKELAFYCVTEEQALSIANEWTSFAKGNSD